MTDKQEKIQLPKALWVADALTEPEWLVMQLIATVHEIMVTKIIEDGPGKWGDVAEVTSAVHVIERMIQGQAAARIYPDHFRLLGGGDEASETASAEVPSSANGSVASS